MSHSVKQTSIDAPKPLKCIMLQTAVRSSEQRMHQIALARQAVLHDGETARGGLTETWITRSWVRCLAEGQRPDKSVTFDVVPAQALNRIEEANHSLLAAARPALKKLGHAIANTRYFAILTNSQGVVVDVDGHVDRNDPRANTIARIGVDLSERAIGTSAIGAALTELRPVWLHRGEHFYSGNAAYSCAGAPLFGPDGHCVGMLDLTGVDADERPELKYLVAQSARTIENALTLERPHSLLVRLNWPGRTLGDETDGLVCLDADGWVTGANQIARALIAQLSPAGAAGATSATGPSTAPPLHSSELFAMPYEMLFEAAGRDAYGQPAPIDVPLWSGLRLHAISVNRAHANAGASAQRGATGGDHRSLRDVESALIRKAVMQARGNVMQAARELGISRATVYRKLGNKNRV
jgi:sigma-54 dependent transcriptional regulator, acetoin dehydrogenase operon transcriptional activator AcoR